MMHQRIILPALIGALMLGACGGRAPEVAPAPVEDDSARLAEEARRRAEEEEARRRAEEERLRAEEARRAEEAARRAREILSQVVYFDYDRFNIRSDAEQVLASKVGVLRANAEVSVRIEGHADERGSDEYNLALGMRRANAVKDFLVGYGLDASRFEVRSFGEERPVDPASNESAWARNRRAEFMVTAGQVTRAQ